MEPKEAKILLQKGLGIKEKTVANHQPIDAWLAQETGQ
jgi:hypothetical protein